MRINIFEGARRVMILTMIVIFTYGVSIVYEQEPDVNILYETASPNGKSIYKNNDECSSGSYSERSDYFTTTKGHKFNLILCSKLGQISDQNVIIPDGVDPVLLADMKAFKVQTEASKSPEVEKLANEQYWQKKLKYIFLGLGITLLSIIGFWLFCRIIGWVVRGFAGISMGKDFKS